jgi:hypothetical protein
MRPQPLNDEQLRWIAWQILQRLDEEGRPPSSTTDHGERASEIGDSVARSEEWISESECIDLSIRVIGEMRVASEAEFFEREDEFWAEVLPGARALNEQKRSGNASV